MPRRLRLNRYASKRKHKVVMKKRYGRGIYQKYRSNLKLHEAECREDNADDKNARNGGYEYWQAMYVTGKRKFAKSYTNRMIRAFYRDIVHRLDEESMDEVQDLRGSDYEKMFDYWNIIW